MIKKVLFITFASILLLGCGATQQRIATFEANRKASEFEMLQVKQKVEEITCKGKDQCDLLFRIASDVLMEKSDMKVQNNSQNYVATFNPTQPGRIGISVRRSLVTNDTEKVIFSATCADRYNAFEELCNKGLSIVYRTYLFKLNDNGFKIN